LTLPGLTGALIGCSTWPGEQLRSELVTIRVNSYKEALMGDNYKVICVKTVDNKQYLKEYTQAIKFFKSLITVKSNKGGK
jgi:hypothetical protein